MVERGTWESDLRNQSHAEGSELRQNNSIANVVSRHYRIVTIDSRCDHKSYRPQENRHYFLGHHLRFQQQSPVVQRRGELRVVRAQGFLADDYRTLTQRLRLVVLALKGRQSVKK